MVPKVDDTQMLSNAAAVATRVAAVAKAGMSFMVACLDDKVGVWGWKGVIDDVSKRY
jgi:hypothetical protein